MKTIHGKLLVPMLCAILAGGLLMGYVSYQTASDAIINASRNDGLHSVQSLNTFIDQVVNTARLDLSTLAAEPALKRLLRGEGS